MRLEAEKDVPKQDLVDLAVPYREKNVLAKLKALHCVPENCKELPHEATLSQQRVEAHKAKGLVEPAEHEMNEHGDEEENDEEEGGEEEAEDGDDALEDVE